MEDQFGLGLIARAVEGRDLCHKISGDYDLQYGWPPRTSCM